MPRRKLTQKEMKLRVRSRKRNILLKKASVSGIKRPEGLETFDNEENGVVAETVSKETNKVEIEETKQDTPESSEEKKEE